MTARSTSKRPRHDSPTVSPIFQGSGTWTASGTATTIGKTPEGRIKRPSFGKLEIELTFDDPGAYTRAWTVRLPFNYVPDSEVTESFCEENLYEKQIAEVGLTLDPVAAQGPPASDSAGEEEDPASPRIGSYPTSR